MTSGSTTESRKLNLRDYQKDIVDYLLYRDVAGIFADPGMGKTSAVLTALSVLCVTLGVNPRVMLVAPLRVCRYVWPLELAKWAGFGSLSCSIIHGTAKQKKIALSEDTTIKLVNPEGLPWLFDQPLPQFDILIIDESTMFKSSKSVRFRLLKSNLDRFPRRYILTGAPMPLGLIDLWAQCFLLDKGGSLGKFVTHFRREYFDVDQKPYQNWATYTPKAEALQRVADKISHMCLRVDAKTSRSMPPMIENIVRVGLPPKIRAAYDKVHKDLILELEGKKTLLEGGASKYAICCQLANGLYFDDEHNVTYAHGEKIKALRDLHAELGYRPILIGYHYTHDLDQLKAAFPSLEYFGQSEKKDGELVAAWNDKKIQVIAAQYQVISHGLNLQYGCRDVVWFCPIDNWGSYDQFNRRVYGRDLEVSVTVHLLVTSGTVDEVKLARLRAKETGNAALCKRLLDQD